MYRGFRKYCAIVGLRRRDAAQRSGGKDGGFIVLYAIVIGDSHGPLEPAAPRLRARLLLNVLKLTARTLSGHSSSRVSMAARSRLGTRLQRSTRDTSGHRGEAAGTQTQ